MRPGREVDTLIAKHVFNHEVFVKKRILFERTPAGERPLKNFTKDIEAAFEVAEKLNIGLLPIEGGQWFAIVGKEFGWKSPADFIQFLQEGNFANSGAAVDASPAKAICLAAMMAVQGRLAQADASETADAIDESVSDRAENQEKSAGSHQLH